MGSEEKPENRSEPRAEDPSVLGTRLAELDADARAALEKELDRLEARYVKEREIYASASQASMASYDKAVLTVSAAALALSTRLAEPKWAGQFSILLAIWGLLVAAVLATVWSLKASARGTEEWVHIIDKKWNYDQEQACLKHVGLDPSQGKLPRPMMTSPRSLQGVRVANVVSFCTFSLALLGIVAYLGLPYFCRYFAN